MLFNAMKLSFLASAIHLASCMSINGRDSIAAGVVKRHQPADKYACGSPRKNDVNDDDSYVTDHPPANENNGNGHPPDLRGLGPAVSPDYPRLNTAWHGLTHDWSHLVHECAQVRSTIEVSTLEVSIQATIQLAAKVEAISGKYKSCGCSPSDNKKREFETLAINFVTTFQLVVEEGRRRYGQHWIEQLNESVVVSQKFSIGLTNLKEIALSLNLDLYAALNSVHVNIDLFASIGLKIESILGANLSIGGSVGL